MIIITGLRKVNSSPDKPDREAKSHLTLWGISDIDHNVNNEEHGPFKWIYVIIRTDFCCIRVFIMIDSVYSHNS